MGLDRAAADYGAPFTQSQSVQNPEEEQTATQYNAHACDSAMLSLPAQNWVASFLLNNGAAPLTISSSNVTASGWNGTGVAARPVVTKSATGTYALTFPSSFTDDIGRTVNVSFRYASAEIEGATDGRARVHSVVGNIVNVLVYNTSNALSDINNASKVVVFCS